MDSTSLGDVKSLAGYHVSNEKNLIVSGTWGIVLPRYIGIIVNHYQDPY